MNTTANKASNEISQLVKMLTSKGLTEIQAVSYLSGLFYAYLDEDEKTEAFSIVGEKS